MDRNFPRNFPYLVFRNVAKILTCTLKLIDNPIFNIISNNKVMLIDANDSRVNEMHSI